MQVLMNLNELSLDVLNPTNQTRGYSYNSEITFVSIALSFNIQDSVTNNIMENIQNVLEFDGNNSQPDSFNTTSEGFQVLAFQPQCK